MHTLYFDTGQEVAGALCRQLSHFRFVLKRLVLAGNRHSLTMAGRVLSSRDGGRIYFHQKGHQFKPCPGGYRREENAGAVSFVSKDSRLVLEPDDFYAAINRVPFETPMIPEWTDLLRQAMTGVYVKPLTGVEPQGEYLDHALTPPQLDAVVKGLVKRKVLPF